MKPADFRKQIDATAKQIEQRTEELDTLKEQSAALHEKINAAIDEENISKVEELTAQLAALDNKIRAAELILNRKKETSVLDVDEVAAASNAEMAEWQKRIDKAQAAADAAFADHLRKLIEVASLVNQAWKARAEYIRLLPWIEDPESINAQTTAFNGVGGRIEWGFYKKWNEPLMEINPAALDILTEARKDRFNRYAGRGIQPPTYDVKISKYD